MTHIEASIALFHPVFVEEVVTLHVLLIVLPIR